MYIALVLATFLMQKQEVATQQKDYTNKYMFVL